MLEQREGGAAKESEAFVVVAKAIDGGPGKIPRSFDQVCGRARRRALYYSYGPRLTPPLHRYILNHFGAEQLAINLIIKRQHDDGVDIVFAQRFGQGTGDIGKTAGLGEGHNFRGENRYAHALGMKDEGRNELRCPVAKCRFRSRQIQLILHEKYQSAIGN